MGDHYSETVTEAARRIRESAASQCVEMMSGSTAESHQLCRLALIDAIEEATGFDIAACHAGRIADAVLRLLRQGRAAPDFA